MKQPWVYMCSKFKIKALSGRVFAKSPLPSSWTAFPSESSLGRRDEGALWGLLQPHSWGLHPDDLPKAPALLGFNIWLLGLGSEAFSLQQSVVRWVMTHCLWAIYFISRILRFLICREGTVTARASAGCHGDQMTFLGSTELSTCHIRKCLLHSGCYCWLGSQMVYAWVGRAYLLLLRVLGCPFCGQGIRAQVQEACVLFPPVCYLSVSSV